MWKKSEPEQSHTQPVPAQPIQPAPPTPRSSSAPPQSRGNAVIGPTISIKGDLSGEEDLVIEGSIDGKIELRRHTVTVGKNGRVKADIYGKNITIEGSVEGNLYGEEQLVLRQSGTVRGNIVAPRVALEDGSNFKGSIDMSPKEKTGAVSAEEKPVFVKKVP
jgi:cytoskeletal protein CcmA (bactofilin family)